MFYVYLNFFSKSANKKLPSSPSLYFSNSSTLEFVASLMTNEEKKYLLLVLNNIDPDNIKIEFLKNLKTKKISETKLIEILEEMERRYLLVFTNNDTSIKINKILQKDIEMYIKKNDDLKLKENEIKEKILDVFGFYY